MHVMLTTFAQKLPLGAHFVTDTKPMQLGGWLERA